MKPSIIDYNNDKLAEILKDQPATTHIYFRRDDGVAIDIPLGQAEFTIKQHPTWMVESGSFREIDLAVSTSTELPVVPPKPSEELEILPPNHTPQKTSNPKTGKKK